MIEANPTILKRNYWIVFIIISVLAIVYWVLFDFIRQVDFDTPSFIGASRLMFHLDGGYNFQSRLSKPLVLFLPGLAEYLTGIHPKHIFLLQNIVSYYALGIIVYQTIFLLLGNTKQALTGVIVYFMSQPFAVFSLFYLVDVVGWLFGFYVIYFAIKHFQKESIATRQVIFISAIASLGLLVKESAIIGFIFLILFILLKKYPLKQKTKHVFLTLVFVLIPFLISNILTQKYYGVSVFSRISEQHNRQGFVFYNSGNFQQLFRIFDVYWFVFVFGIGSYLKTFRTIKFNSILLALLSTAIIALLTIPIYPFIVDRILFMVAPALLVFIVIGSNYFGKYALPAIIIGGIINITSTWLIYKYDLSGVLKLGYIAYCSMLLLLYLQNKYSYFSFIKTK